MAEVEQVSGDAEEAGFGGGAGEQVEGVLVRGGIGGPQLVEWLLQARGEAVGRGQDDLP